MSSIPGHATTTETLTAGHREALRDASAQRGLDAVLKRMFDVAVALTALVVLLPVLALVAMLVKTSSPGPVLFRHRRLGRGGRLFTCLKFRTMVPDADRALEELFEERPELRAYFEEHYKLPADPRVTRVGRWLRKTSLDELPQLWNVLRGEMSVVGPRPIVTDELSRYGAWQGVLLSVRPGLTGPWQVTGRSDLDYADRVALDVAYIRECSFWGDVRIVLRTARVVLAVGSNGAY